MNILYKLLRKTVIKTSAYKPLENFYKGLYYLYLNFIVFILFKPDKIEGVLLRGSVASGSFRPGNSDIDLIFILKELEAKEELRYLKRFWYLFGILHKICPLLVEIAIINVKEFNLYMSWPLVCYYYALKDGRFLFNSKFIKMDIDLSYSELQSNIFREAFYDFRRLFSHILTDYNGELSASIRGRDIHRVLSSTQIRLFANDFIKNAPGEVERLAHYYKFMQGEEKTLLSKMNNNIHNDAVVVGVAMGRLRNIIAITKQTFRKNRPLIHLEYKNNNKRQPAIYLSIQKQLGELIKSKIGPVKECINSIILSPSIWGNYNYKLIIVLKSNGGSEDLLRKVIPYARGLRKDINALPFRNLFDQDFYPLICCQEMCNCYNLFDNPLDFCKFRTHSVAVYGDIFFNRDFEADDFLFYDAKEYILRAAFLIRRRFKSLKIHRSKAFYAKNLIDFIAGFLPASRLLMETKSLVFSVKDALDLYQYLNSPYIDFLQRFHNNYIRDDIYDFSRIDADTILDQSFTYIKYELGKIFELSREGSYRTALL
ncbi:MAG: nucleotidyltransferase domain-containing protein [Candidatus Orphnella occulta]|nr:nucleotidyltransferase domain-containing protein [Candidatus Orphnella occulta]